MLKLSLKPGEYITLGDNIKIVFSGGSANNIHLLVDATREINVARNSAGKDKSHRLTTSHSVGTDSAEHTHGGKIL